MKVIMMMRNLKLHKPLTLLFLMLVSITGNAVAEQTFTVAKPITFKPGSAKFKALLSKIEDAKDVMDGRYLVGTADLNDDGRMEIILQSNDSMNCGSGGCLTVVIEQPKASSTQTYTLLSQNLGSSLAVTNEKVGNYRALASLMEDGKIQVADKKDTPLYGKQMVYAMNNASPSTGASKTETTPPESNPQIAAAPNKSAPSIAGISLGMSLAEAKNIIQAHIKTYNRSLELEEQSVVGVGAGGNQIEGAKPYTHTLRANNDVFASKTIQKDSIVVLLSPPPSSKVVKVSRELNFTSGNEIHTDALTDQLRSKYGTEKSKQGMFTLWFFDNTGKAAIAPAAIKSRGSCNPSRIVQVGTVVDWHSYNGGYKKGQAYGDFNPACGTVLMMASPMSGPTNSVTTTLVDYNAMSNAMVDSFNYLNQQSTAADGQDAAKAKKRAVPNL